MKNTYISLIIDETTDISTTKEFSPCLSPPQKILKPSQTRWLSLHSCVSRVLEQWDALILYFQAVSQQDHLLVSERINSMLQNLIWKLYFHFLNFVVPKFTDLNTMFQCSTASIHCVYSKTASVYKEFLSCFMSEASW